MNYWHINLHPTDDRRDDAEIKNFVLSRTIGMGQDFSPSQENAFKNTMQIGDVVVVLNGRTSIALVEVIGDWYKFDCDEKSIIWFPLRRAVKILCMRGDEGNDCFTNLAMIPKTQTGTLGISNDINCATYKYIHALYECCKNKA
ncbi:MAG: hypothetical protein K2Y10_10500 [Burkholderiaceae bacterium]|nr:hypothetical protein [Burkholderiaceae bacterium]